MSLTNKIEKDDLARDALYEKVNAIAEELDAKKQDLLVSATNIKTINGESIIGSGDLEIKSGGSGRNVGDIFYTTRTDSELNGAVECNGGTYNIGDFEGEQSVGNLLNAGSLPYVSLSEYLNLITTNGYCRAFGWDGGTSFRVPLIPALLLTKEEVAVMGTGDALGLRAYSREYYGIMVNNKGQNPDAPQFYFQTPAPEFPIKAEYDTFTPTNNIGDNIPIGVHKDPKLSGLKGELNFVEYRAMVQLANEATDEALITATSALQQIANKVDRSEADYVVETYQDGTEWYRVYKSGWIEQGGVVKKGSSLGDGKTWDQTIPFLKPFKNTNYSINVVAGFGTNSGSAAGQEVKYKSKTENSILISLYNRNSSTDMDANIEMTWEVKGQGA